MVFRVGDVVRFYARDLMRQEAPMTVTAEIVDLDSSHAVCRFLSPGKPGGVMSVELESLTIVEKGNQ